MHSHGLIDPRSMSNLRKVCLRSYKPRPSQLIRVNLTRFPDHRNATQHPSIWYRIFRTQFNRHDMVTRSPLCELVHGATKCTSVVRHPPATQNAANVHWLQASMLQSVHTHLQWKARVVPALDSALHVTCFHAGIALGSHTLLLLVPDHPTRLQPTHPAELVDLFPCRLRT